MSKPRTGAPKRVAVGLLAGALATFGVALAPPAGAAASVSNERLAGATRYGTAAAIAADEAFAAPTTAIVATGENFPDALAASSLAGANAQAPIILTQTGTYTTEAKAGLAALKAKGVTALTIVGGTVAVSQAVEDAIKADGFTVSRVAGDDRYETAAAIATAANTKSPSAAIGGLKTGLFATGVNFPDALAGGPAAYANKLPLLLVNEGVPAETANAISTLGIKKAVILGGTSAVSSAVEAQLVAATGNPVTRLAGVNRYSTAAAIGDYEIATLAFPATAAVLATGTNFPDALAAGPLGGQLKAPIVLTASLPEESRAFLDKYSSTIQKLYVSGGTSAIDDATVAAAEAAAETVGNDSAGKAVTTRPELVGAQILATTTATQVTPSTPAGTTVRYTFDEALGAGFTPVANLFKVWDSSNNVTTGTTATTETGTGTTGTTVVVNFSSLATAASVAGLTKATVAFEAVRDASGAANPEGEAPIGTAGSTPTAAATTTAPDLRSVGNFRQASTAGNTAVDFTFDQAAFTASSSSGFHLVTVNGGTTGDITCTGPTSGSTTLSGGTIAGGEGTTTFTVICPNVGGTSGPLFSSSNVARGYVIAGAVTSGAGGGGTAAPQEAADVAGSSLDPDLVSVAYTASTGVAIFTFDQVVSAATGTNFYLYTSTGAVDVGENTATVNSANQTQVSVPGFALNATTFVGGGVFGDGTPEGATRAVRTADGRGNLPDEEGFAGSSTTVTPGRTSGPDLTAVALSTIPDAFGNTSGYAATYTFDVAATTALTVVLTTGAANFHLYLADGTRYNGSTCTAGDGGTTNGPLGTVKCTAFTNSATGVAVTSATPTALQGSVLGTVSVGAVTDSGSRPNPEGAAVATGGNGTPAS